MEPSVEGVGGLLLQEVGLDGLLGRGIPCPFQPAELACHGGGQDGFLSWVEVMPVFREEGRGAGFECGDDLLSDSLSFRH